MTQHLEKRTLALGLGMLVVFGVILGLVFTPLFKGRNGLEYLDDLYNSISKGSAYFIPKLKKAAHRYDGVKVSLSLQFDGVKRAARAGELLRAAGARVSLQGERLTAQGDLGRIMGRCLADADRLFHLQDARRTDPAGLALRGRLHIWWLTLRLMEKDRNRSKNFEQAIFARAIQTKAVECAYNYYGISAQRIGDNWLIVFLSLVFYVVYTVWFGYGIFYLFQGAGFKLEH